MTASNHSRSRVDTAAAAILSITGALLLFGQLDIVSSRLHLSILQPWVEWWPLLLIISGVVLLLAHRAAKTRSLTRPADQGDNQ
ncbi:MAG: hypothetical protein LAP21_14165 [Acidobacteriia bacterium]|nr:hypothetical protein [Terriglobia bacterium]